MSCFSLCVLKGGAAMRYDVLLFDVDDTLLDFGACEQEALHATFARFALPFSPRPSFPPPARIPSISRINGQGGGQT